jgi:hypothetical protein
LEIVIWILASVAALGAFLIVVPVFLPALRATATPVAAVNNPPRATLTPIPTSTPLPLPTAVKVRTPNVIPTLVRGAQVFTFTADFRRTGWIASGEREPHWAERNLYSGSYKGQIYQPVLFFELSSLAPKSKILFAQVELAGLNRSNLGATGGWSLKLLPLNLPPAWDGKQAADFRGAEPLGVVGAPLEPADLGESQVNWFTLSSDLIAQVERAVNTTGLVAFRLDGPVSGDSLFTWDGGDRDPSVGRNPILRVIAVPGQFNFITNTPVPQNVLTAAAVQVQSTRAATRFGTPTSLPRSYATIPPNVVVTSAPTPSNEETATAQAAFATAVAITTGTFTPTPLNWVTPTFTPTPPLVIPVQSLTPTLTPTPTPTVLTPQQSAQRPIPAMLYNKILFQSGSRQAPSVWVVDPDGKNLGLVVNRAVYDTALARDAISPNGSLLVFNAPDRDNDGVLQIWYSAFSSPDAWVRLTALRRGIAFAPAWSPDGNRVAYVSSENGPQEIWVYDFTQRASRRLTSTTNWFWNQFPLWSPDGKQIVFSSDRGHNGAFSEIWIMNADGTGQYKLGDGTQDAWQPVWIKWKQ